MIHQIIIKVVKNTKDEDNNLLMY